MHFNARLLLTLALIALMSHSNWAQRRTTRPPASKPSPTKAEPLRPSIKVEYDRFKDRTNISVGPLLVDTPQPVKLELGAMFNFDGQKMLFPADTVNLFAFSTSKDFLFRNNHELLSIIDGQRVRFGEMHYDYEVSGANAEESMYMLISRETLLKLARATTVELQLGHIEFQLSREQLKLLGELADRMIAVDKDAKPPLELLSFSFDPVLDEYKGDVQNTSNIVIKGLTVFLDCKMPDGTIKPREGYVWRGTALGPQEKSEFELRSARDFDIKDCKLRFQQFLGGDIPFIDKSK